MNGFYILFSIALGQAFLLFISFKRRKFLKALKATVSLSVGKATHDEPVNTVQIV